AQVSLAAQESPAAQEPPAVQPALPAPAPAGAEALPAAPVAPPTGPAPPARVSLFHRHPRGAQPAWVAAANPLAVEAGLEILGKGGNAVDAAVAVQAMLGLVEPQSSGIAGGAFLLYYDGHTRKVSAIDGRERAPAGAQPDMFLDEHGKPLPFVVAVRSGRSTGVPGAIAMLHAAHARFGALRWKEPFQPAIRAATAGFRVPARLAMFLGEGSPFPPTNEVRTLFSRPDGDTIQEGDLFRNPEYARTLERIALDGPRALYQGAIAYDIVAATHQAPFPGTMTLKDLSSYRATWAEPLCRPYRGYSVCAPPPPGELSMPRGRDATAESAGTSHFVIVDADGNAVSMTTTVESIFGSGRTVRGFVLNNQLTDFSFVPTDAGRAVANAVQGGKRPRSSMSPVIVLDRGGNFVAAL